MNTQTKEIQDSQSPQDALDILKEGNHRFQKNVHARRNLLEQVTQTSGGQYPFAVVLSCIDSRVPVELVFDQGIGDIFSARVAGNIVNEDILGSIEYGCKVAGSKVVVVLGHSKCGAVTSACKRVELGNITPLLSKITPAVDQVIGTAQEFSAASVEEVSALNVRLSVDQIRKESAILADMESKGEIKIIGAMYHVESGNVEFYE